MTQHTFYILFFSLIFLGITSCKDDDFGDNNIGGGKDVCDVELGNFSLAQDSRSSSAVEEFSELVFINELGEEKIFSIGETELLNDEATFTEGDSITFCYAIESFTTTLSADDGLEFDVVTESKPYYPDVESKYNADVLKVFYNNTRNMKVERRLVFRKVIDIKDYPAPLYTNTVTIDEKFFIDDAFKNVEVTQFNSPIVMLYYHDSFGVIAYEDEDAMLWQLKERR